MRTARSQAPLRPALISMSLTHVHLRVSDTRIMLRAYRAAAFDPEKAKRGAPATREGDASPQEEGGSAQRGLDLYRR